MKAMPRELAAETPDVLHAPQNAAPSTESEVLIHSLQSQLLEAGTRVHGLECVLLFERLARRRAECLLDSHTEAHRVQQERLAAALESMSQELAYAISQVRWREVLATQQLKEMDRRQTTLQHEVARLNGTIATLRAQAARCGKVPREQSA